jgi:acyl-coenzyme A synthetase/AMP-(fatty) acid ligase
VNGEKGELCIAGDSVMSGYWNNAEQTTEAFFRIPTDMGINGTAYRSGDIVRKDDQGNYLYVGRKDRMVKCKGYRIELGEIEHVIRQMNPVQEAAVVATEHNVYENKIVAFLSLNQNNDVNETAIRQYCKQKLPHYMIPERVYFLDEIPRTSTEKVDYARLKGTAGQYDK